MKEVIFSVVFICSALSSYAEETKWAMSLNGIPFKSCKGQFKAEAVQAPVIVAFTKNSIEITDKTGKKKTYASQSEICDLSLKEFPVSCKTQDSGMRPDGNTYFLKKACNVPHPRVPSRLLYYRVDLDLALNIYELNGKKTASGFLSCVIDDRGFHGVELSDCK